MEGAAMKGLLVAVAVIVPGGLVVLAVIAFLRRRIEPGPDPWLEARITPPKYRWNKADEGVRQRTTARRDAADRMRSRAAHVESGSAVSDLLRRVK
jgi:hypothetical protein